MHDVLSSFLLMCIGIEIVWQGIAALVRSQACAAAIVACIAL